MAPSSGQLPAEMRVSFESGGEFIRQTRREVEEYLSRRRTRIKGRVLLYTKAPIAIGLVFAAWAALLYGGGGLLVSVGLLAVLTIGAILTAFCVQHDANHGAYFGSRRYDHLVAWISSDAVLGFSSYSWRVRHNVAHHTYTNVDGFDGDITQIPVARFAPSQERRPWHRLQAIYIWPLYGMMTLRLQTYGDLAGLVRGRIASSPIRRPRGWDLVGIVVGKLIYVSWAIVLPMFVFDWWLVLAVYVALSMLLSLAIVMIFQLAHCVEEASWPSPADLRAERRVWSVHEVETTVDFCQRNPILTWALGGLNFQIEHHLFPRVPHTHYPALAGIVRRNSERHGIRYTTQASLRVAMRSHVRHLRQMARLGLPVEIEMG